MQCIVIVPKSCFSPGLNQSYFEVTAGHPVTKSRGSTWVWGVTWGQTPERNSRSKRSASGITLWAAMWTLIMHKASEGWGTGLSPEPLQGPSTPVLSPAVIFTIRVLNARFLGLSVEAVFIHFEQNCLHRSYCFWLSADSRFTSGSYFLFATTEKLFFLKK